MMTTHWADNSPNRTLEYDTHQHSINCSKFELYICCLIPVLPHSHISALSACFGLLSCMALVPVEPEDELSSGS